LYALLLVAIAGCKKQEDRPAQLPDDKLTAILSTYQKQLTGAEYGWTGYQFPNGGGAFTFTFKFDEKNRVVSMADINATTAATGLESSYRLKAAMQPSLYFDTYTYLHILADPDQGLGGYSDFEFGIQSASTDTIKLKGNVSGSEMILVRTKQVDAGTVIAKSIAFNASLNRASQFNYYYNRLSIAGKTYDFTLNPEQQTVNFYYAANGTFKSYSTEYAVTSNGILLRKPFTDGDLQITEMHELVVDVAQNKINFKAGNNTGTTTNVATPLAISLDAASALYTSGSAFTSNTGFTNAGRIDFFGLTTIPGYGYILLYPKYFTNADAMFILYGNRQYGPAFNIQLPANGALIFAGNYALQGTSPGAAYTTAIASFRAQVLTPLGYYVFPTGKASYDLVSVADSKIWIRF
ncbi:MAG: DUF4302 domain-containing protein, partial [Sphingobacteriaceae bacterium]